MTKNEVVRLMENIKTFYHNFSFPPDLVEAWYERLKDVPFDAAKKNLDRYIAEDEIGRMPTIAKIMRVSAGGNVEEWHKYRESMKLRYHDHETMIDQNGYLWAYPTQDIISEQTKEIHAPSSESMNKLTDNIRRKAVKANKFS